MRKLIGKREQIGTVIETAFRRWLSSTDQWDLVEAGIHQRTGVTLDWRFERGELTLRDIRAEIIPTFGTPYEPHRADFDIPGFVGYLPHVPLIRRTHRESDISALLLEWNVELPAEEDDPWRTRLDRLEDFMLATRDLIPLARASLDARFTADVHDQFVALGEVWFDIQRRRVEKSRG